MAGSATTDSDKMKHKNENTTDMTHNKFLKSYFLSLILLLPSLVAHAQLTATVNIVGSPTTKTSDWTGQFRKNRVLVTVVNPRLQITEGVLNVKLLNGSGVVIAETIDDQQTLQQFNNGSTLLDLAEVLPTYGNAFKLNDESLRDKLNSGFVPEDNYQICVNIIDVNTRQPLLPAPICKFIRVIGYQAPILVFPPDKNDVKVGSRPILRWNGVSPRPAGVVKYRLQVFEIASMQSPEIAYRSNVPYVDEIILNQTQWIWGSAYELPKAGMSYVWGVQALDEDDKPIGEPNGQAVPFMFNLPAATKEDKKAEEETILAEKPLDRGKIRFTGVVKDNVLKNKMVANATVTINYTGTEIKYRKRTETYTETTPGKEIRETQEVNPQQLNSFVNQQRGQGKTVNMISQGGISVSGFPPKPKINMARVEIITRIAPTSVQKTRQIDEPYTEKASKTIDVTTDATGKFSFDVEDGQSITLLGKAKGYFDGKPEKAQISVPQGSKVISGFSLFLEPKAGRIEGIVTNAQTKRGITGIIVEAFKASDTKKAVVSGTTNSSGAFSFKAEVGDYVLKVNNEQYEAFTSKSINIRPEETVKSDIILKPFTAIIAGKITETSTNKSIEGARVAVYTQSEIDKYLYEGNATSFTTVVTTGSDGSYEITDIAINKPELANESYVVLAIKEGYGDVWKAVALRKGGDRVTADLKMVKRSSLLLGTVTDDVGDKISKVKVDVYSTNGALYKSIISDGNGEYVLKDILATTKLGRIVFSRDGWSTETVTGTFTEFKSLYVADIVLKKNPPITVRGIIKNQFGEAFEGVTVTCEGKNATTDKQGKFVIENTSILTQKSLTLSKAGETKEVSFTAKLSPSWELEETLLEIKRNIVLKFVDESGNPLTGVSFTLKNPDGKEVGKENLNNAEWAKVIYGNASWVGKKLLLSWTHSTKDPEERNIDIKGKDWFVSKTAFSYTLIEKTITIKGKIANKETGVGVEGVTVSVNGSNFSTQTDVNGNYSIPKVPFQEKWQLKGEKKNFTSNVLDVTNPFKITEVPQSPTIDNQSFTLKRNFINPENIFGFKATVSKVQDVGNDQFEIDGTLDIPQGSEIKTTSGKIDFQKFKVDANGLPLSNSNNLSPNLPVTIHGVSGNIKNAQLRYINTSGVLQATTVQGALGVLTGEVTLEETDIFNSKSKIPALTIAANSGNFPMGIRSSGTYGGVKVTIANGAATYRSTAINFKEGGLSDKGVMSLNVNYKLVDRDISNGRATFTYRDKKWEETNIEGKLNLTVENRNRKHLFTMTGNISYNTGLSQFVLTKPTLRMLESSTTTNGSDLEMIKITEKGKFADNKVSMSAPLFKLIGIDISAPAFKLATIDDETQLVLTTALFQSKFEKGTKVSLSLGTNIGVKASLENDSKEGLDVGSIKFGKAAAPRGLSFSIAELTLAWGGAGGDFFKIDGDVELFFGAEKTAGTPKIGGGLAVTVTLLNGQTSFKLNRVGISFGIVKGFQFEGELEFLDDSGVQGKFTLAIEKGSVKGLKINANFRYVSSDDFFFKLFTTLPNGILIGPAVRLTGLGGEVGRKGDVWTIGISGAFTPTSNPELEAKLTVRVIFGAEEFIIEGEGTISFKKEVFGDAKLTLDIGRRRFDGTVNAYYNKTLVYISARINAFFDFSNVSNIRFRVDGNADLWVLNNRLGWAYFKVSNDRGYFEFEFEYKVGGSGNFSFGMLSGGWWYDFSGRIYANERMDADVSVYVGAGMWGEARFGDFKKCIDFFWKTYCIGWGGFTIGGFSANAGFGGSMSIRGGYINSFDGNGFVTIKGWLGDGNCCSVDCNGICASVHKWGICGKVQGCASARFRAGYSGGWYGSVYW